MTTCELPVQCSASLLDATPLLQLTVLLGEEDKCKMNNVHIIMLKSSCGCGHLVAIDTGMCTESNIFLHIIYWTSHLYGILHCSDSMYLIS